MNSGKLELGTKMINEGVCEEAHLLGLWEFLGRLRRLAL